VVRKVAWIMRPFRFFEILRATEEQIVYAIKHVELGVPMAEVCQKYSINQQTFYRWRKQYGGLEARSVSLIF